MKVYVDPCGMVCGIPKDDHRTEGHPWVDGHVHGWQPAAVEKWIVVPTVRVVALCDCGATRRFGVEDDE